MAEKEERSEWEAALKLHQHRNYECFGNRLCAYRRRLPTICYLLSLGPCECYEGDGFYTINTEIKKLKQTIGFALYGKPTNDDTGYSKKKLRVIESIFKQILKIQTGDPILMSIVYVSLIIECNSSDVVNIPVFRVPKPEMNKYSGDFFVDFEGRLYQSWAEFVCKNNLPKAIWCYPENGIYSKCSDGHLKLYFGSTPAAKLGRSVLRTLDKTSSILGLGCVAGTFFPPASIPCAVACGALGLYNVVRESCKLADRGKHGQSLKDREAFSQWLSLANSVLSIGSFGVTAGIKAMAKDGKVVSDICCKVVDGVNGSSLFVKGVCIVEKGLEINEAEGKKTLLYVQFMVQLLVFAHSAVNFKTAKALVNENRWPESYSGKEKDINFLNYISSEAEFESQFSMEGDDSKMATEFLPKIQQFLKKVKELPYSDVHIFLEVMRRLCKGMKTGTYFMDAIDIVLDASQCRDVETALKIANKVTNLASEFCMSVKKTFNEEKLKDKEFIPTIISKMLGSQDQDVYYFPEDHRDWDSDGTLKGDDYLAIAKNTFGLANVPAAYFKHEGGIAFVSFKHVGSVKITSRTEEKMIVIQKFKGPVTDAQIKN